MDANNVAVLRGTVSSEPRARALPSGSTATSIEVTTRTDGHTATVPVVVFDQHVAVSTGDDVVVVGRVQRRFYRAGGSTQSRTEVVATHVVPARRGRTAARAVAAVVALLGDR